MVSYARKLISEHGVSEFGHMACPNSDFFFLFFSFFFSFFLRVSQMSFLKLRVTRATRAFYTGEKRATLIGSYEQGGLNMIDIPSFFNALKIKWISRFLNEGSSLWFIIFRYFMKKFGGEFILYCNMSKRSCKILGQCPGFYQEILSAYFDFRSLDSKYKDKSETIVWNNESVTVDGKTVFVAEFFMAGLWYISDLFDREGKLIDFNMWMRRGVEKKMYMKWCSIVSAIPKELKLRCLSKQGVIPALKLSCDLKGKDIDFKKLTTQTINFILKGKIFEAPTSEIYWNNKYDVKKNNWKLI